MAQYTEEAKIDQVTLDPVYGTILWRVTTTVFKDGVEWKKEYERFSMEIDDINPARLPAELLPYRALVDTPEAKQRTKDKKDKGLK